MNREEEFEMMLNNEIDEIEMMDGMMGDWIYEWYMQNGIQFLKYKILKFS